MDGLQSCKFLIVDSSSHMRQILEAVIRGFGVRRVSHATYGHEADALMRQTVFDVVMIDYVLHDRDGIGLIRQVRHDATHPNRYSAFVGVSSSTERRRIEAARDAGVSELCCKPIIPKDMFRKLVAACDYPRGFVLSPAYIGPDRRRRNPDSWTGEERRADRKAGASAAINQLA